MSLIPNFLKPTKTVHLYRLNPMTGQDAETFFDVPESTRAAAIEEFEKGKKVGAKYYWHRMSTPNGKADFFSRVELTNFKTAFEIAGFIVRCHEESIPEIK